MKELFLIYLRKLLDAFLYDYSVFSEEKWMYYWACIPAFGYLVFFILKWVFLTLPFWLPPTVVLRAIFPIVRVKNVTKKSGKKDSKK